MPKKIFNSDLETSGQVVASTLTDGTATLSGGVFTASTLTDGTATLSGGVLTASTITTGTATLGGGTLFTPSVGGESSYDANTGIVSFSRLTLSDTNSSLISTKSTSILEVSHQVGRQEVADGTGELILRSYGRASGQDASTIVDIDSTDGIRITSTNGLVDIEPEVTCDNITVDGTLTVNDDFQHTDGFILLRTAAGQLSVTASNVDTSSNIYYDLVVYSGGDVGDLKTGRVLADTQGFTGVHRYLSNLSTETFAAGSAVVLDENNLLCLSSAREQTTVVGIVGGAIDIGADTPDYVTDSLGTIASTSQNTSLVNVLSVGDTTKGTVRGFNVCNENGDIQPGDLLVTSSTPGYLMKQDDDIIRSKTVGKAMESVTFDDNGQATGVYGFIYCG